jgi:phosphatidylglycerophosphate synthase
MSIKLNLYNAGYVKATELNNPIALCFRVTTIPLVKFAVKWRIRPNVVTTTSLIFGLSAVALYFQEEIGWFFVVWTSSILLDYADGTIARKSNLESYIGYLFDTVSDRIKLLSLVIVCGIRYDDLLTVAIVVAIIILLTLNELISHLLVPFSGKIANLTKNNRGPFYSTFCQFDMHSFFIYGLFLYMEGSFILVANFWLAMLQMTSLVSTLRCRVDIKQEKKIIFNSRYFKVD